MEKDLIRITAKSLGEDPKMVVSIIRHYEKFIADTIRSGEFNNVRVPLFGIFRVNLRKLKYLTHVKPQAPVIRQKPTQ